MPRHRFVSGKEILARVIRALGYKLPSVYHDDILEWIAEGMGMLQVTNSLELVTSEDENCPGALQVRNYCVQLPCGYVAMEKLEDANGRRIFEESKVTNYRINKDDAARPNIFYSNPWINQSSDGTTGYPTEEPNIIINIQGGDLTPAQIYHTDYYTIKGNMIQTSFECGYVKMTYWAIPTCDEGYPLIPDNENYKQALEWHIIRRLIGSGYEHKVFTYKEADTYFEQYATRGMNEVSYYSPDSAAKLNRTIVRLIPPMYYGETFFA